MIKSFVGPMHSGKSDALISIYNKIWNKSLVCAFKPRKDERDKNEIRSKNYEVSIPAIYILIICVILTLVNIKIDKKRQKVYFLHFLSI